MPAATAAAEPPLDPDGVRSRFHGLRVVPNASVCVTPSMPNSAEATIPTGTAPAARSRATCTLSRSDRRRVAKEERALGGGHALAAIAQVLDAERDARERAGVAAVLERAIDRRRALERERFVDEHEGVDALVLGRDLGEALLHHRHRRGAARAYRLDDLDCGSHDSWARRRDARGRDYTTRLSM